MSHPRSEWERDGDGGDGESTAVDYPVAGWLRVPVSGPPCGCPFRVRLSPQGFRRGRGPPGLGGGFCFGRVQRDENARLDALVYTRLQVLNMTATARFPAETEDQGRHHPPVRHPAGSCYREWINLLHYRVSQEWELWRGSKRPLPVGVSQQHRLN